MDELETNPGFIFEPLSGKSLPVKPCPFCGSPDIQHLDIVGSVIMGCMNCGARGPNWDYSLERAIPSWNHRPEVKE